MAAMSKNDQEKSPSKIWNSVFVSIFFANMAMNLGQQMSNSLLAKYADHLGAPATQIGVLMGMFAMTALALRFISGPAMDTYNRKYIIMGAMAIMAVAYFGFSISKSIYALMGFRLLQGCGNAFGNAACIAMISEALPKDKFGTGMGYYSLAQVIVQAIAPNIALYMAGVVGYGMTYAMNGVIMLIAIVVAYRIKIDFKRTGRLKITLQNIIAREALFPAIILLILAIGFHTINSFLIIFADKQGVSKNIGLFFTVYASTLLFTRPLIGRLTDKYGLARVAIPALFCTAASFLIISFSTSLVMFLVAAFVNAFGFGACQPALQSIALKTVPRNRRGSAISTNYIGMDIGTIIGPTLAGYLAEHFGYVAMWRFQIAPFLIAIAIIYFYRHRMTKIEKDFLVMAEQTA